MMKKLSLLSLTLCLLSATIFADKGDHSKSHRQAIKPQVPRKGQQASAYVSRGQQRRLDEQRLNQLEKNKNSVTPVELSHQATLERQKALDGWDIMESATGFKQDSSTKRSQRAVNRAAWKQLLKDKKASKAPHPSPAARPADPANQE